MIKPSKANRRAVIRCNPGAGYVLDATHVKTPADIVQFAKSRGLTNREIQKITNRSPASVKKWANGTVRPPFETLADICRAIPGRVWIEF